MMKISGIIALSLTLFGPALAQQIPLINPQQLQIPATGADFNNLISQMNASPKAGGQSTFYVAPIAGDNAPQLTTALAGFPHVVLTPGYYRVCSQVEVPRYKHLSAFGTTVWQGSGAPGWTPPYPLNGEIVVGANGCSPVGGSFGASQGFFHLHDNAILEGFAIQSERQHSINLNCVNAINAVSVRVSNMEFADCNIGVDRESTSAPGDEGSLSQGAVIDHNAFVYNQFGIVCEVGPGGGSGCADEVYSDNEFEVPFIRAIFCGQCSQSQWLNNRMEDGGTGIEIQGANYLLIAGNFFNRIAGFLFTPGMSQQINIMGNKMSGVEPGNTTYAFNIQTEVDGLLVVDNRIAYNYIAIFNATAPGLLGCGAIHNNINTFQQVPPFANTHTASIVLADTPQVPNNALCFLGGVGLEDFTGSAATFTTLTAAGPTGDTVAARLTEDGTTNVHFTQSPQLTTISSGTTYTDVWLLAPGSSGTRNVYGQVSDGTNIARAIFTPSTCAFVASQTAGTGSIVGTPSAVSIGGGWCRAAVSFTGVPGSASTKVGFGLASGTTVSYAGDSASNALLEHQGFITGVVAPGLWGFIN